MSARTDDLRFQVWSASYAGVEVFQQLYNGTAVMRRRKDSFVNVTQILKCAQYDKPHRTRFLEREIHTGIHEKVQGGYGKYQGTWVPLDRAIALARRLNVYEALRSLFEYNPAPGEKPPTAPRSLESLHKRKLQSATHGAASKRRIDRRGETCRDENARPGSLTNILNAASDDRLSASAPAYLPQAPPVSAQTPRAGNGWHPATPGSGPATSYTHHHAPPPLPLHMTPDTPGARAAYVHGDGRATPSAASDSSTRSAASGDRGWPLRDVSNTYHAQSPMHTQGKPVAKPGAGALMTPPSSTSVRRAVPVPPRSAPLVTPTTKPRQLALPTPAYTRPPVPRKPSDTTWAASQPIPAYPTGGEDAVSPVEHPLSAPSSRPHQGSESPLDMLEQLVNYLSRVRWPHRQGDCPAELKQYIQSERFNPHVRIGGSTNSTTLHLAVQHGHWDVVQMLLDRGADPAVVTRLGVTPLMMAVGSRHAWQQRASGVFEWLLTALAQSLIRRDKEGRTAVHWACMRPAHESQDEWKHVSHYYVGALVRRLELSGQREVLTWQNYAGRRAEAVARADGLDAAAALLAAPADRAPLPVTARDIAEAPPRNASPTAEPAGDRYSAFAAQAAHAIQRAASDMRREHQQQLRQIDDDTRFAAKLLLELRSERDATQASAQGYQDVEQRCVRAKAREEQLIQRVESAVNLQQSARASLAVSRAAPESAAGADPQALRAEYRRLRQQAQSYEHESRRLACEYAELAAAVRPWARPPALSAVDMFAEGAGPAAAGSEPGGGPAGAAADERLGWADRGSGVDAEAAEAQAIAAVLQAEERRLGKLERVVSAACGDLSLDRVRTVVGPVLSVLNNGNTL